MRYLYVFIVIFSLLPSLAQAQEGFWRNFWNKSNSGESRIPYTVTVPSGSSPLHNLFIYNRSGERATKTITAKPRASIKTSAYSTEPHSLEELKTRADALRAPQMAALEIMRADNLKKAEALNKQQAQKNRITPTTSQPVSATQQPLAKTPAKKTIYLKPAGPLPQKVFPENR